MQDNDYEKIMLTLNEKWTLYRIFKKVRVSYDFCNEQIRDSLLNFGLIDVLEEYLITKGYTRVDESKPRYLLSNDKTLRYFLYRKEAYFKGKLPVVIAIIALIISIASFANQYI